LPSFLQVALSESDPALKEYIRAVKLYILHALYVSIYGLLGSLTNFHPYILSVWGSDVYVFPVNLFFTGSY